MRIVMLMRRMQVRKPMMKLLGRRQGQQRRLRLLGAVGEGKSRFYCEVMCALVICIEVSLYQTPQYFRIGRWEI
jgi:hypothetical protein